MDTDVVTTQMTLMGIAMVVCALIVAGVFLLRGKRAKSEKSKFEGEAH